ncbi:hypothetical protein BN2537_7227 [Streptomyces venezuelae]|nr:hypothetical protein BN2537_7227 [Streptomyces venezuelae]
MRVFRRTVSPRNGHRDPRLFRLRRRSARFDTPDRVGRRVFQVSFTDGTQKPEK